MCRHLAWLGPTTDLATLLLETTHGLQRQAWHPRHQQHGNVNVDGFGIGWYPEDGTPPARYRRAAPIWADGNLPDLMRTSHSSAVLAAVRDASVGTSQDESAVAPYSADHWLFSLNGAIPDWTRALATSAARLGTDELLGMEAHCDTALLWVLLLTRLRHGAQPAAALSALATETLAAAPQARLNLLLTDGRRIYAVRHGDSLWYRQGGDDVRVASEPDDEHPDWRAVPHHSLLTATPAAVHIAPLAASPTVASTTHPTPPHAPDTERTPTG